jgi:hypothetical protein
MSLFKVAKYSTLLFFMKRHKKQLHRLGAAALLLLVSYFLLGDLQDFFAQSHPDLAIYVLVAKSALLYGAAGILIWQWRPKSDSAKLRGKANSEGPSVSESQDRAQSKPSSRLDAFKDLDQHDRLQTRYQAIMKNSAKK